MNAIKTKKKQCFFPSRTALYAINENTDYTKVKALASVGNEVASHTIHHILAQGDKSSDYANISAEVHHAVVLMLCIKLLICLHAL